jgi:diguanylate cyclase (GGDEF)-like protein
MALRCDMSDDWLYRFKRKIIAGFVLLLALSMTTAMLVVITMIRNSLLNVNEENARQLGSSISSSLKSQMLNRSPEQIQNTIKELGRNEHISKIFILNKTGRVDYSSDSTEIGKQLDIKGESCRACHHADKSAPSTTTTILHEAKGDLQRNITVIYNEPACFGCHPENDRINGKLIIDKPLSFTYALITRIEIIVLASALLCLLILIPFLSRMLNRYIDQILLKNSEINLIYSVINNISKTIDIDELKHIVLDIMSDALSADEVDIVLPRCDGGFRLVTRTLNGEKITRKIFLDGDPMLAIIERWLSGNLRTREMSADLTEVFLPISKGDIQLALITARCKHHTFSQEKLKLVEAINHHIAIAFENARLYSIAITDELTGLYTVRHFRLCIDRQFDLFEHYGEKNALLMIDIDNFKRINDNYGHLVGDAVLKQVGRIIAESVRADDLPFRYGGEEFCIILPATVRQGALLVAERIRSQIESAVIIVDELTIKVTVSSGMALCPENSTNTKGLIMEADKALYTAKDNGKNRVETSEAKVATPSAIPIPDQR